MSSALVRARSVRARIATEGSRTPEAAHHELQAGGGETARRALRAGPAGPPAPRARPRRALRRGDSRETTRRRRRSDRPAPTPTTPARPRRYRSSPRLVPCSVRASGLCSWPRARGLPGRYVHEPTARSGSATGWLARSPVLSPSGSGRRTCALRLRPPDTRLTSFQAGHVEVAGVQVTLAGAAPSRVQRENVGAGVARASLGRPAPRRPRRVTAGTRSRTHRHNSPLRTARPRPAAAAVVTRYRATVTRPAQRPHSPGTASGWTGTPR